MKERSKRNPSDIVNDAFTHRVLGCGIKIRLLMNFHAYPLTSGVRRLVWNYEDPKPASKIKPAVPLRTEANPEIPLSAVTPKLP